MQTESHNTASGSGDGERIRLVFAERECDEQLPVVAVWELDERGQPARKLGRSQGEWLVVPRDADSAMLALGPDAEDGTQLPPEALQRYYPDNLQHWREHGLILPRDYWQRFIPRFVCVSGRVRKCRPWFWDILDDIRVVPQLQLAARLPAQPLGHARLPHVYFPWRCLPVCDGQVEVFERICCCHHFHLPDLLDRLREILERLPIPLPDPIPDPDPGPLLQRQPWQQLAKRSIRQRALETRLTRETSAELAAVPPRALYDDYLALRQLPEAAARDYAEQRPWLLPLFCRCTTRRVGTTALQPGGQFSLCYFGGWLRPRCHRRWAFKVRQLIDGVWTLVYDGVAAHDWFAPGDEAEVRTSHPRARTCADGPGDAPPNEGQPFVMLEYVGAPGTHHFNFPPQVGPTRLAPLAAAHGTVDTGYAPDCPWAGVLGLRLWFSPELQGIARYYRLKVVRCDDQGLPQGTTWVLNDSVTWDKLQDSGGDVIRVAEVLGPLAVGSENDLFRIPYWSSPDHRYLTGQFHQQWDTSELRFGHGRFLLLIEIFDAGGNRLRPDGAVGPGTSAAFQFRRWSSDDDTDAVDFADAAHLFWIDNTPVRGDIVDLRHNGLVNNAECQFLSGSASSTFAIGMRAFHVNGVEHAGNGDQNSFMWQYAIHWQRGLNGSTGSLGHAPSAPNAHTDVGESGGPVSSGSVSFETLLRKSITLPDGTPGSVILPKCTFSVSLHVYAKHFNGASRLYAFDYHETASFAVEISS